MSQSNRIPSLDGLRAISIAAVVVGHFWQSAYGLILAAFGVNVFFVISGFLITSLLETEWEHTGKISLSAFYHRRAFRIFPAAFTYIFVIALLVPGSRSSLPYALTYTVSYVVDRVATPFIHLWSLSIEEQFYFLWPLVLVLSFKRRAAVAWILMLVSAMFRLVVALNPSHFPPTYLHYFPLGAMDSIGAGCLLAIYQKELTGKLQWMANSPAIAVAVPLTAWILSLTCFAGVASVVWGIVPLLVALSVFLLIHRRDWILNNRLSVAVGTFSYSLYLWQEPFTVEHRYSMIRALCMAVGCALASYFLVEKPMLKIGSRVRNRGGINSAAEVPKPSLAVSLASSGTDST